MSTTSITPLTALLSGKPAVADVSSDDTPEVGTFSLGVNLSGLEWGTRSATDIANQNYALPTTAELDYYHAQGLNLIRLPFAWERLQPTLGGELDHTYLTQIETLVNYAAKLGMKVILDNHSASAAATSTTAAVGDYGTHKLGDGTLTNADFANLWQRLATVFAGNSGIAGYDLMNEPNGMTSTSVWPSAAQAAIDAIRSVDTGTTIYVEGDHWSGAATWTTYNNDLAALNDPSNKLVFSAHLYLDADASGTDDSWSDAVAGGVTTQTGVTRLENFVSWLKANNLQGSIGEIGVPNTDINWLVSLDNTLAYAQASNLQVTYWAGGPWWYKSDYALSVEPSSAGTDAVQMAVLDKYTGKLATLHVRAPALSGTSAAYATVTLTENGTTLATTTANASGQWAASPDSVMSSGTHLVEITQTASDGTSTFTALSFNLDITPPDASKGLVLNGNHTQYQTALNGSRFVVQDTVADRDGTQSLGTGALMQFTDGVGIVDTTGDVSAITQLYQASFDRLPDLAGLEYWTSQLESGATTLDGIAQIFTQSSEFSTSYGSLSNSNYVAQLYTNVLGRTGDSDGTDYWVAQLKAGVDRGQVLQSFAGSFENIQNTTDVTGNGNRSEAYRLYQAALQRTPDTSGLSYWTSVLDDGATPAQVAQDFLNSTEFQSNYGLLSNSSFVNQLYQNVLGRDADSTGAAYWTDQLNAGTGRAQVLLGFSDSQENRLLTSAATHADWTFLPNQVA